MSSGGYADLGYRLSSPLERWQRVVECSGLEDGYAAEAGVGGSNPPLSASYEVAPEDGVCRSPISENKRSETVRKAPISFGLKPQKPTKRFEEALFRC
jgi:hypothetical protein